MIDAIKMTQGFQKNRRHAFAHPGAAGRGPSNQ
jgi:hypothetical protein